MRNQRSAPPRKETTTLGDEGSWPVSFLLDLQHLASVCITDSTAHPRAQVQGGTIDEPTDMSRRLTRRKISHEPTRPAPI